ncbi:MAG: hypothetical protein K2I78_02770 [Clostridia bacterium]|nr:hypothetical protein [Clostridia bacterium]MDE7216427.1 hypothetical protein [Clostridia bacterium]
MILLLAVSAVEIVVGAIVAAVVVGGFGLHFLRKAKARKNGKGSCCSGDCSCCAGCSFSFRDLKKQTDKKDGKEE